MLASILLSSLIATATPLPAAGMDTSQPMIQLAQADCSAAAQRVVSETGGQLLSATPSGDGNCSVTVLVPGQGERPRRVTVTVPAG